MLLPGLACWSLVMVGLPRYLGVRPEGGPKFVEATGRASRALDGESDTTRSRSGPALRMEIEESARDRRSGLCCRTRLQVEEKYGPGDFSLIRDEPQQGRTIPDTDVP